MRRYALIAAVLIAALVVSPLNAQQKPERSDSLLRESRANVKMALDWLTEQQLENGSWQDVPAITGLVVRGMINSGIEEYNVQSEPVQKGLAYIRSQARPNGGIYTAGYANYNTAMCVMALADAGLEEDNYTLQKAREFLLALQADEGENFAPEDWQYGGWGYEQHASKPGMHKADMSNTQFAVEALARLEQAAEERNWDEQPAEGDKSDTELAYGKAITFLTRCQNNEETNDWPRTADDGGFRYRPDETRADGQEEGQPLRSYGSISYAGCKSLIFCGLEKDDPRVRAVYNYVRRNWTVEKNPNLGQQSLYYYYMTMSKCLNVYGVEVIVTPDGTEHDWRTELVAQLMNIQGEDAAWRNEAGRWMERIPELTTAYAVLAIERAWENW
jgi:squalene-hopene/tetraprenyl-beta-curcumene cyclase